MFSPEFIILIILECHLSCCVTSTTPPSHCGTAEEYKNNVRGLQSEPGGVYGRIAAGLEDNNDGGRKT